MPSGDDDDETPRERLITNIGIVVFVVLLVAAGIWIANTMIDTRESQECVLSGRRNCAPIAVPDRQP